MESFLFEKKMYKIRSLCSLLLAGSSVLIFFPFGNVNICAHWWFPDSPSMCNLFESVLLFFFKASNSLKLVSFKCLTGTTFRTLDKINIWCLQLSNKWGGWVDIFVYYMKKSKAVDKSCENTKWRSSFLRCISFFYLI